MNHITVKLWDWIYCNIPIVGLIYSAWQVDRGRVTPFDRAGWPTEAAQEAT